MPAKPEKVKHGVAQKVKKSKDLNPEETTSSDSERNNKQSKKVALPFKSARKKRCRSDEDFLIEDGDSTAELEVPLSSSAVSRSSGRRSQQKVAAFYISHTPESLDTTRVGGHNLRSRNVPSRKSVIYKEESSESEEVDDSEAETVVESTEPIRLSIHLRPMEPFSRSQIVQEWISPTPEPQMDYGDFKGLSEGQKEEILRKEAENNCIERPQGYNVSFHYNSKVEQHHFGKTHPMKPWRLQLTKQLVLGYGLEYAMDMYQTRPATKQEIAIFHDRGYLDFLELVTPNNVDEYRDEQNKYNFGIEFYDCPVFDGMWDYISLYSGATMDAARKVCSGQSNIAINWSGGLHHAKKSSASGFCYVNDIVLAIQYMMQYYSRILYIDIDVHHGDGVEQAFHSTNRVMTLSYHKYAPNEFFPGTGGLDETGPKDTYNEGAHHSLNVPLKDGIDDHEYKELFKVVTGHVIEAYKPQAIVIQCGADSLGGDRLGRFNLNITAHGYCVEFVKATHLPLLIIGGGGYTPRNVARTWTHETALCVGAQLHDDLPWHIPYRRAFSGERNGDGKLYPDLSTVSLKQNQNTAEELHTIVKNVHWEMRYVHSAPHVQMDRLPPAYDKIRDEIDREIREEQEEKDRDEAARKRRERNVGARGEMRMR